MTKANPLLFSVLCESKFRDEIFTKELTSVVSKYLSDEWLYCDGEEIHGHSIELLFQAIEAYKNLIENELFWCKKVLLTYQTEMLEFRTV